MFYSPVSGETSPMAFTSIREQIEKSQLVALGCPIITHYQAKQQTLTITNNGVKEVSYLPNFPKQPKPVCYLLSSPVGKSCCCRWRTKVELPTVTVI